MVIKTEKEFRVPLKAFNSDAYKWCVENLKKGTWMTRISVFGESETYRFDNEEDCVAFKICWAGETK